MTTPLAAPVPAAARPASPARLGRSIAAVAAALVGNAVLATATDQLLHVLEVYPPWGQPMLEVGDNLLALGYRTVYGVLAGYVAARLAPRAPMRHALALGVIALATSSVAAAVAITRFDFGPDWYPIVLAATSLPTVWLGGLLHERRRAGGRRPAPGTRR